MISYLERKRNIPGNGEASTHDQPPPDIQLMRGTTVGHLTASEELVDAVASQHHECQWLFGGWWDEISKSESDYRMLDAQAGEAAAVAAEG
jgi:hypothetical protein